MSEFDKFDSIKKDLIEQLRNRLGNITDACKAVNISRQTYYNYLRDDPEFRAEVEAIAEESIDFVESKLFEKINGVMLAHETKEGTIVYQAAPDTTAIIFFLKTRAKKRGYIEKTETEISTKGNISLSHLSTDDLYKLRDGRSARDQSGAVTP